MAADAARPRQIDGEGSGTNGNGERRRFAGGGWYQRVAQAIANLGGCSPVREDDGGGRRRGRSGGELRLLSDGRYGGAPATATAPGGRGGDGEHGGVLHDDAATTAAAQFDGDEARPIGVDEEMRRRWGSRGGVGWGLELRRRMRSRGSHL